LKSITDVRKKLSGDLKVIERDFEYKRNTLQKSDKVQKNLNNLLETLSGYTDRMPDIEASISKVMDQMTKLMQEKQKLAGLQIKKSKYVDMVDQIKTNISALSENLEVYFESDEELQRLHQLHNTDVHRHDTDEITLEADKNNLMTRFCKC
jgi:DNA repair ATPase RecN